MEEKLVSRRGFIMGAAAAATGAALLGSPLALAADGDPLPDVGKWPYAPLDPDAIGTLAKAPTGCSGCGGKSAGAIIYGLREALPGGPWDQLPVNMGSFANGGGPYGATCGAAAGPFFIMQLVGANGALGTQFHKWYCDTAFPSTEWDALFPGFEGTVQSVAGSPLCHESRSIWENVYLRQWDGVSPYDGTRCSKLPMDTAKKAVQMLNDWALGILPAAWEADADYATCYGCHTQLNTDHKVGAIHSSQKENCTNCHTVPAKHPAPAKKPSRKKKTVI
jgi:hypothetical protein